MTLEPLAGGRAAVYLGDCRDLLRTLADDSVDAIVTDPPYELAFMGRKWDSTGVAFDPATWREALRVLKPGGFLLAFGGTRTFHRLTCAIEDAGFLIGDSIGHGHAVPVLAWLQGQGFPKDKNKLKPAWEPIVVARKPLVGAVAANVLQWGCGALNVDGCRVATDDDHGRPPRANRPGRWPTNVVLSHAGLTDDRGEIIGDACDPVCVDGCPVAELDAQSGDRPGMGGNRVLRRGATTGVGVGFKANVGPQSGMAGYADSGGASRFFPTFRYQAKAPRKERPKVNGKGHVAVKPLTLMRWLVRLVTPPGGLVVDPFAGSGTTLEAAVLEGFLALGADDQPEHLSMIRIRMERPLEVRKAA